MSAPKWNVAPAVSSDHVHHTVCLSCPCVRPFFSRRDIANTILAWLDAVGQLDD
jgi:hypothetical protein